MTSGAPLTDGRLILHPLTTAVAPAFADALRASADPVRAWMGAAMAPDTPEAINAFVQEWEAARAAGTGYAFAAFEGEARCVGFGFLNALNTRHRFANLGYWVRADASGRGLAPAMTRLLARFGFEALGLQRVELVVEPANAASRRVAEKAGAVLEGHLRHRLRMTGDPRDALLYSLLPADLGQ